MNAITAGAVRLRPSILVGPEFLRRKRDKGDEGDLAIYFQTDIFSF